MRKLSITLLLLILPSVGLPGKPSRIVSLDLCTDWMLLTYADHGNIRALSPLSKQYPLDGPSYSIRNHDGSLEVVLSLQPDVVITGEFNAPLLRQRLQELDIRVEVMPVAITLQQVEDYEKLFLSVIGETQSRATKPVPVVSVVNKASPSLLLLGANAGGTGLDTLEHDIITHAGWNNYVKQSGYVTLDLEKLVADPPDMIIWSAPTSEALANSFMQHPALKKTIPKTNWMQTDFGHWQCQGPWTWQRVKQLQKARQQWRAP